MRLNDHNFQIAVQTVALELNADSDREEIISICVDMGYGSRIGKQIADELGRRE